MKWQLKPNTTTVYWSSRCPRKLQRQRKGSRYIERRLLSDPMAGPRLGGVCVKEALIKSRDARCGSGRASPLTSQAKLASAATSCSTLCQVQMDARRRALPR